VSAVSSVLEDLIRHINRTNSGTVMADSLTLTDALAERDVLRLRYSMRKVSADAASGAQQRGGFIRSARSELKLMSDLDIKNLRQQASDVARRAVSSTRGSKRSTGPPSCRRHDAVTQRVKLVGKGVERVPTRLGAKPEAKP
jgi:hypothetical protein